MAHDLDFGIDKTHHEKIAKALHQLLADTYALYLKTQNFHWNVEDPRFFMLHEAFEKQYIALRNAVDEIAERIRQFGQRAPGSFKEFMQLTKIKECTEMLSGNKMIEELMNDHAYMTKKCREILPIIQEAEDDDTEDLLTTLMKEHEKTAWMLRSSLK